MKRVLCVCCVIMLVMALVVPAMAAESYYFYPMPSVFSSDFSSFEDGWLYDGFLPDGTYDVYISSETFSELYLATVVVSFEYFDDADFFGYCEWYGPVCLLDEVYDGAFSFAVGLLEPDSTDLLTYTMLYLSFGESYSPVSTRGTSLRFIPVEDSSLSYVFESMTVLGDLVDVVLDVILDNWFLVAGLCVSLLGAGVVMITKLKRIR